jgi:hypothetical protein
MLIKFAVAPVPHASDLLRFSLKTGEIKQTLALKSEIQVTRKGDIHRFQGQSQKRRVVEW